MTGLLLYSYVALWILFLVVALVLVSVLRNLGIVYSSLEALAPRAKRPPSELKAGDILPEVTWQTLAGDPVPLTDFGGHRQAVAIVSPTCSPCADYLTEVARNGRDPDPLDSTVRLGVIVSFGDAAGTRQFLDKVGGFPSEVMIVTDSKREVTRRWGITATPTTIIVDDQMRVVRQIFGDSGTCSHQQAQAANDPVPLTMSGGVES